MIDRRILKRFLERLEVNTQTAAMSCASRIHIRRKRGPKDDTHQEGNCPLIASE